MASVNVSANPGQVLSTSSLFGATDADNDTLTYFVYDANADANSGHFVVNGAVLAAGVSHTLTAAQLAQTTLSRVPFSMICSSWPAMVCC